MKRLFLLITIAILLGISCNKSIKTNEAIVDSNSPTPTVRHCATDELLQEKLREDPSLKQRMEAIEVFTRNYQRNPDANRLLPNGTLEVPVVVNVLYRTAEENISLAQIQSQIQVLNEDFGASNSDYNNTPTIFRTVRSGDIHIQFVLANVVRKETTRKSWPLNDAMKKTNQGGIPATDPETKLNIWVCTMGHNILGYAYYPGTVPPDIDGVVILNTAFGNTGSAAAPFDKGRTATHEIGHYFNLHHIWGDATCGDDLVDDTPIHTTYNFGCPSFPYNSSCGGTVHPMMTMNYMDYTDDACMFMFSAGQKTRMQATYAPNGPRSGLR